MAWNVKDLVKGDNLLFYLVSGATSADTSLNSGTCKVLAYATSASIQIDSEAIDTSSKFSCKWGSNYGGRASYTVSVDALYCQATAAATNGAVSFDVLMDLMVVGEPVRWVLGQELERPDNVDCDQFMHQIDTSLPYFYGKAAITSLSLSAGNNEIASCSMTMNGDGPIESGTGDKS